MTTITAHDFSPVGSFGRIWNVVKLNVANPWTTIILPWMIQGIVFVLNLSIWWVIFTAAGPENVENVAKGLQYSGATTWVFIYMMVVAIQAVNLTFPFALGYGVTRRDFWLGSSLTFVLLSGMYAAGLTILSVIEDATNGWGFGGRMFTMEFFGENAGQRLFIFFVAFLFFFFFGAAIATVYVRWRATGVTFFFVALGVVLVGAIVLLTLTQNWQIIGNFFAGAGLIGTFAWSLVLTLLSGVIGYLILRKATPRN